MRLSDFITENLESILNEWEAFAREIRAAQGMNSLELRDHARQVLETIAKDLATAQSQDEQKKKSIGQALGKGHAESQDSAAEQHAALRVKSGFSIADMISEYRALRASVLRLSGNHADSVGQSDLDDMTRFNEAIDQAVAESVARYSFTVRQAQDFFLGILGHDLRNPLGAITMSAQLLMQNTSLDNGGIKKAALIYHNSLQMSQLIEDLLDFARTRLGQGMASAPAWADFADIVRQAVAQASAFHPDRAISFDAVGDLNGNWDTARIGQVFSNLIGNAIQHGDGNEPVRVVVTGQDQDVIATIHNFGNPIPKDLLPHIFEPLRRTSSSSTGSRKETSLGLGLYIAREIVQAHWGTVNVTSSIDDGTTFTVWLPRQRAPT